MKSPELILNPEGGSGDWIILLQGEEIEPDPIETVHSFKRTIVHQPRVIVPDEAIAESWQIGEHGKRNQKSYFARSPQGRGSESRHVLLGYGTAQSMLGAAVEDSDLKRGA